MTDKELILRIKIESPQIKEVNAELETMKNRIKILTDIEKENGALTDAQNKRLSEAKDKARELISVKNDQIKAEKSLSDMNKTSEGSMARLRAETSKMIQEANNLNLSTKEGAIRFKELQGTIEGNKEKIRDFDRSMSGSSTLVGEYGRGIKEAFFAIGSVLAGAAGAFSILKEAIGSTEGTAREFEAVTHGMKSGIDQFFRSIMTGDWGNLLENMEAAIQGGYDFIKVQEEIEHKTNEATIFEASKRLEMEENRRIFQTTEGKTLKERIEAGNKYMEIAKQIHEKQASYLEETYNAIKAQIISQTQLSDAELTSYAGNYTALNANIELAKEYTTLQETIAKGYGPKGQTKDIYDSAVAAAKVIENQLGPNLPKWQEFAMGVSKLGKEDIPDFTQAFVQWQNSQTSYYTETRRVYSGLQKLAKEGNTEFLKDQEQTIKDAKKIQDDFFKDQATMGGGGGAVSTPEKHYAALDREAKKFSDSHVWIGPPFNMFITKAAWNRAEKESDLSDKKQKADLDRKIAIIEEGSNAIGQILSQAINGQLNTFQAASSVIVRVAFDLLKKMVPVWVAQITGISLAQPDSVLTFGASAVARVAVITALLEGAVNVAESAVMAGIKNGKAQGGLITMQDGIPVRANREGDNQLILAKRGEVVINESQRIRLGGDALRMAGVPGFAMGGIVGSAPGQIQLSGGMNSMDFERMAQMMADQIKSIPVVLQMNELASASKSYNRIKTRQAI